MTSVEIQQLETPTEDLAHGLPGDLILHATTSSYMKHYY